MDAKKPASPFSGFTVLVIFAIIIVIGGCFRTPIQDGPPTRHVDVSQIKNPVPHYLPKSKYGNSPSYTINGKRYHVLSSAKNYRKRGIASWYGTKFDGQLTSTREPYNLFAMTAASPELPIPCFARVTNLENGKQIIVKVNDRGPFAPNRIIDLSYVAAKKLGYANTGTALVEVSSINVHNPNHTNQYYATHHPELYLQVGAFAQNINANRLKTELKNITRHAVFISHEKDGRQLYFVKIGPLQNAIESDNLLQRIAQAGLGRAITVIS